MAKVFSVSPLNDRKEHMNDLIELTERDYTRLLEGRNAFAAALQRLADVSEAMARKGDDSVPASLRNVSDKDVAAAVNNARVLLDKFGLHQAFLLS
jgi:hypothetical protein